MKRLLIFALVLAIVPAAFGQTASNSALKNPAGLKETAPAMFNVKFDTSAVASA